eukprot:jgi/Botrbrau1/20498/Bobra.145_2s0056.1
MLHTLDLAKRRQWSAMAGWHLLSEKSLAYREDAVRLGLFIGGFTGLYRLLYAGMARQPADAPPASSAEQQPRYRPNGRACFVAGSLAGLMVLVQPREWRRTLALYAAVRAVQCWYNSQRAQGRWHFWGSNWDYGDAALFAICSAQVMYAYVMRPETLPPSFWKFIVRSGPVPAPVLEAVRRNVRGLPIDVERLNAFLARSKGRVYLNNPYPPLVPVQIMNPGRSGILGTAVPAFIGTFRKTFPLYLSLTLVPSLVFNLGRSLKAPLGTGSVVLGSALRSTAFLSSFVGLYQATVSAHRALFDTDTKYLYWFAGLVASLSILVERKSRRGELALYVAPRALDTLMGTLLSNRVVPRLPLAEVALFSVSMGSLMYYRVCEPDTIAPFLKVLISRIVFGQQPAAVPRRPSEPYFQFRDGDVPGTLSGSDSSFEDLQGEGESPTSSFEDVSPLSRARGTASGTVGTRGPNGGARRRRSISRHSFEQIGHSDAAEESDNVPPKTVPPADVPLPAADPVPAVPGT